MGKTVETKFRGLKKKKKKSGLERVHMTGTSDVTLS